MDPYSLNPDPAKNLDLDPDPSCFLKLPEKQKNWLNYQKKSIERYNGIFQLAYAFLNLFS